MVLIDGFLDSLKYLRILQENIYDVVKKLNIENDFVFQQDNDLKHCSKFTKKKFEDNDIKVLEWLSQSPDMNVIEHVWAYVKKRYNENPGKNKNDALNKVLNIWNNIPIELIHNLDMSVYRRFEAVINAKGGAAKY